MLTQRAAERAKQLASTMVTDPTGEIPPSVRTEWNRRDDDVLVWDVASELPDIAQFYTTPLHEAGWDSDRATDFVTETFNRLLCASDLPYSSRTDDDVLFTTSNSNEDLRSHLQKAVEASRKQHNETEPTYNNVLSLLNRDRKQRRM